MKLTIFLIFNILVHVESSLSTLSQYVQFHLYTSAEQTTFDSHEIVAGNLTTLANSKFNFDWDLKILVHGYTLNFTAMGMQIIRQSYHQKGNFNVIIVNWTKAQTLNYLKIRLNLYETLHEVGAAIAILTKFIYDSSSNNYSCKRIHLIGHSLGAHIVGLAGKYSSKMSKCKYKTICGLDPAGPLYHLISPSDRLASNDADYVEVIHTDISVKGIGLPIGKSNIYPNYGFNQPHCNTNLIKELAYGCSHLAAVLYFAESINSNVGFYGCKCLILPKCSCKNAIEWFQMGGEPLIPKNQTIYLRTNSNSPFALGKHF